MKHSNLLNIQRFLQAIYMVVGGLCLNSNDTEKSPRLQGSNLKDFDW